MGRGGQLAARGPARSDHRLPAPRPAGAHRRRPGATRSSATCGRWRQRMRTSFWKDGLFWGSTGDIGQYYGQQPQRLRPHAQGLLGACSRSTSGSPTSPTPASWPASTRRPRWPLAYDAPNGRWAKYPTSATTVASTAPTGGPTPRADQLAATLALHDPAWIAIARRDRPPLPRGLRGPDPAGPRARPLGEPDRGRATAGPTTDTAKCNEWKSGFHSTEHALVMYLFSHWLAGTPAPLYFAFPASQAAALARRRAPLHLPGARRPARGPRRRSPGTPAATRSGSASTS